MIVLHDVGVGSDPSPVALSRPLRGAVLPVNHELVGLRAEGRIVDGETIVGLDREVSVVHPDEVTALVVRWILREAEVRHRLVLMGPVKGEHVSPTVLLTTAADELDLLVLQHRELRHAHVVGERVPEDQLVELLVWRVVLPTESVDRHAPPHAAVLHHEVEARCVARYR